MAKTQRINLGGSFAPHLDAAKLVEYDAIIDTLPKGPEQSVLRDLLRMVVEFNATPDSEELGQPHRIYPHVLVRNLTAEEVARIWDLVPWPHEIEGMQKLLAELPPNPKKFSEPGWQACPCDVAAHLLWYAVELSADRQPVTREQVEAR